MRVTQEIQSTHTHCGILGLQARIHLHALEGVLQRSQVRRGIPLHRHDYLQRLRRRAEAHRKHAPLPPKDQWTFEMEPEKMDPWNRKMAWTEMEDDDVPKTNPTWVVNSGSMWVSEPGASVLYKTPPWSPEPQAEHQRSSRSWSFGSLRRTRGDVDGARDVDVGPRGLVRPVDRPTWQTVAWDEWDHPKAKSSWNGPSTCPRHESLLVYWGRQEPSSSDLSSVSMIVS